MNKNQLILSDKTSYRLAQIKGKTGLDTNIICRLAICISLNDSTIPNFNLYNTNGRELKKTEVFGEFEKIINALVKQKCYIDKFDCDKDFNNFLLGHLNRGIDIISNRVKKISDIKFLFE